MQLSQMHKYSTITRRIWIRSMYDIFLSLLIFRIRWISFEKFVWNDKMKLEKMKRNIFWKVYLKRSLGGTKGCQVSLLLEKSFQRGCFRKKYNWPAIVTDVIWEDILRKKYNWPAIMTAGVKKIFQVVSVCISGLTLSGLALDRFKKIWKYIPTDNVLLHDENVFISFSTMT